MIIQQSFSGSKRGRPRLYEDRILSKAEKQLRYRNRTKKIPKKPHAIQIQIGIDDKHYDGKKTLELERITLSFYDKAWFDYTRSQAPKQFPKPISTFFLYYIDEDNCDRLFNHPLFEQTKGRGRCYALRDDDRLLVKISDDYGKCYIIFDDRQIEEMNVETCKQSQSLNTHKGWKTFKRRSAT